MREVAVTILGSLTGLGLTLAGSMPGRPQSK